MYLRDFKNYGIGIFSYKVAVRPTKFSTLETERLSRTSDQGGWHRIQALAREIKYFFLARVTSGLFGKAGIKVAFASCCQNLECGPELLCGIVGCFLCSIQYQYFLLAMGPALCVGKCRLLLTYTGMRRTLASYVLPAQFFVLFPWTPPRVPACYDQV